MIVAKQRNGPTGVVQARVPARADPVRQPRAVSGVRLESTVFARSDHTVDSRRPFGGSQMMRCGQTLRRFAGFGPTVQSDMIPRRLVIRSTIRARRSRRAATANYPASTRFSRRRAQSRPAVTARAPGIIAVVKANAYGHGASRVAPRARGGGRDDAGGARTSKRGSSCASPACACRSSCSAR